MLWKSAIVFLALFALDFVWAKYTYAMTNRWPWISSGYASAIILLNGVATISFVKDPILVIPAMLGAFAGTFLAVKFTKEPS